MTKPVTVRMYDVGFGDCFLLKLDTKKGIRKILFDCGTIKNGSRPIADVVQDVLADTKDSDGVSRIDVIVVSHRHKDHVSGFAQKEWADVEVKEIWFPWTENPEDDEATAIREAQTRLAACLNDNAEKTKLHINHTVDLAKLELVQDMALNALSNDLAMQTLHHGFSSKPLRRYLPDKKLKSKWFETDVLPEVTVHVLGPSYDKKDIQNMDPPAGQSYLKLLDLEKGGEYSKPVPFGDEVRLLDLELDDRYSYLKIDLSDDDRETIKRIDEGYESDVAAALNDAVNGTSLVLLLQFRHASLLFTGDAQWGTWEKILANNENTSLLKDIAFYKVGHHGSHNATPVEFVEEIMPKDIKAMISVVHHGSYPNIPKRELIDAMKEKDAEIDRSDERTPQQGPGGTTKPAGYKEVSLDA